MVMRTTRMKHIIGIYKNGHVMRAKGSLEQDIMLGQVAGYRRQGKP
jgi:hypothetical protein